MKYFFIPGNVPSLKNSKRIFFPYKKGGGRGSRPVIMPSKTHEKYANYTNVWWMAKGSQFRKACLGLENPLRIAFYFIRDSQRQFDYLNAVQTLEDLMVQHRWIEDDSCKYMIPYIAGHHVDKKNPCALIGIIPDGVDNVPKPRLD